MRDGFFELETVDDLYDKLCWEFERLKSNSEDTRIAFNFFVTAEHLPDWMKKLHLKADPIPRICGHLANQGKHFRTRPKHNAVTSAGRLRYVEDSYVEEGYVAAPLMVELDESVAEKAGIETRIDVLTLAEHVMNYWKRTLYKSYPV